MQRERKAICIPQKKSTRAYFSSYFLTFLLYTLTALYLLGFAFVRKFFSFLTLLHYSLTFACSMLSYSVLLDMDSNLCYNVIK